MRLGYHGYNVTLRKQHVLTDRTARQSTVKEKGVKYLEELFEKNLLDLEKIIHWNVEHDILLYRISSTIAPHITNPALLPASEQNNWRALVYDLHKFAPLLARIGEYANKHGMRLTFHPSPFLVLNSPNPVLFLRGARELYYHVLMLKYLQAGPDSVIVLHGGGVYNDKKAAMQRWIQNVKRLPLSIRQRVVLENDETLYNVDDVLFMARKVGIPVVFDLFHYRCYAHYHKVKQRPLTQILPEIIATWGKRRPKFHISEQRPGAPLGTHSDYVRALPAWILRYKHIDWMIESKMHEKSVLYLKKKYHI